MCFAVGLVGMFTIGGLSGVSHAFAPADTQQTDTYYIVAHFHYVLFGGAMFGLFAGMYFWWPKIFGYKLSEKWGYWHFWVSLIGFNLTFGPMHMLGLQGMSRRIFTYSPDQGFNLWNLLATVGAFIIAVSLLIFFANIWVSYRAHRRDPVDVGADPWDARSLEWMVPSPVPEHNFDEIPTVSELDEFWHRKYGHNEEGRLVRIAETDEVVQKGTATGVHLPSPSYWPIVLSAGLPFIGYGVIYNLGWAVLGGILVIAAIWGWVMEPSTDPDADHGHHDEEHDGDAGDGATAELQPGETADGEAQAELEEAPVG
jgi:cytochrome c oxidase subunit 1